MERVKQYIVLRKDVKTVTGEPVSSHKLAVMTAHASMAFLSRLIEENVVPYEDKAIIPLDADTKEWIAGIFTKVLLSAKNLNQMNKIIDKAKELGFVENKDFFIIRDNCLVETLPDDGDTRCLIAIGFRPMDTAKLYPLLKRLQLYK